MGTLLVRRRDVRPVAHSGALLRQHPSGCPGMLHPRAHLPGDGVLLADREYLESGGGGDDRFRGVLVEHVWAFGELGVPLCFCAAGNDRHHHAAGVSVDVCAELQPAERIRDGPL